MRCLFEVGVLFSWLKVGFGVSRLWLSGLRLYPKLKSEACKSSHLADAMPAMSSKSQAEGLTRPLRVYGVEGNSRVLGLGLGLRNRLHCCLCRSCLYGFEGSACGLRSHVVKSGFQSVVWTVRCPRTSNSFGFLFGMLASPCPCTHNIDMPK